MDLHERFMTQKTTEVWFMLQLDSDYVGTIARLIDGFHHEINQISELTGPSTHIETLHTVLCSFYKDTVTSDQMSDAYMQSMYEPSIELFMGIDIQRILLVLYSQNMDSKVLASVLDIIILRMVLTYNVPSIVCYLVQLLDSMYLHLHKDNDVNILDIRLLNCYMDSLLLHPKSLQQTELLNREMICLLFLRNLRLWLKLEDPKKCQLCISVLPKLIKVLNEDEILLQVWDLALDSRDIPANILSMLCLTADIWFPMVSDCKKHSIHLTTNETFWVVLLEGLSSPILQQRKQALYLIKRAVDFTDKWKTQGFVLGSYDKIRPLICTGNDSQQIFFKKNLNNFFLVLEALEEKQKHLITPVFPLLKSLLNETVEPKNGETGLHIAWIRCACKQILQHDNNAIVKWGLVNVLALDPDLYDDDFLTIILHVLNNTYMYENDVNEEEPTVVKELIGFLGHAESKNSNLVTRFLVKASKMSWGPVAIFYVIHALSVVKKVQSIWKEVEFEAVKSLAEVNLTMHCRVLRIGSQIELLEAVTHFATQSLDLVTIANTLSAFSTSEALIRGQLAWKRTSAWLSRIVKKDEALSFLQKIIGQMTNENSQQDLRIKSFSLMLILFHDGHLILNSKSCPGLTMLRQALHCLIGADSRPYANAELRNRSIELIYLLLNFTSSKDCVLREFISDYADAILRFIFKSLRKITDEALINDISTYVSVTQQVFTAESSFIAKREVLNHIERFETESWNIIEDGEDSNMAQRFFGIRILHACLNAATAKLRNYKFIGPLYNTYRIPLTQSSANIGKASKTSFENGNLKGKIAAEYYKFVAELFYEYVKDEVVDEWLPDIDWIEQVSYLTQVGGNDIFAPLIGILSQVFYKEAVKATRIDDFKSTIRICWTYILESNECRLAMEEIIDLIFSSPFLECMETKKLTIECTRELVDKVDKIPVLSIILLKRLKQVKGEYLSDFYDAVLACLLYGTVPRRDQKIELQARSYILECYKEVYPNYLSNMNVNPNVAIRAHAITLLHKMITDDPSHAIRLLPLIAAKLDESQNKRYFADSQLHRLKNRIMQVLLILQPMLKEEEIGSLYTLMCNSILSESSQPSVRIMQEWLLIRIYLQNNTLHAKMWDLFDQGHEKRIGSLCSVMSVIYHVARLASSELQLSFINLALRYIMPCCMSQQFNVRLYAQVIVSKLYNLAMELSYSPITERYGELYIAVSKSLKHGNLMKNSIKLQDDFYFTVFNPVDDYSLQTLFYELPRLSNVSSDEYILPEMFQKFGFKESNSHPLKLINLKTDLSETQVSAHILKSSGSAGPVADDIDISTNCSGDIQKKFIPWKSMVPNEDELNEISATLAPYRKSLTEGDNIILVASLIDKLPNLGGLSRTCEILGVKEFVVGSIKHTEDKEFQSLSVSAEKLITLVEVKPHQLQQYLLEKKDMGYQLIGAEQTVNSTNLIDMKFDKRTVLLLGNEKAGIPANLIPLLDQCVEIPQVGIVRSLNVHVTGAICLWEYFKQHNST